MTLNTCNIVGLNIWNGHSKSYNTLDFGKYNNMPKWGKYKWETFYPVTLKLDGKADNRYSYWHTVAPVLCQRNGLRGLLSPIFCDQHSVPELAHSWNECMVGESRNPAFCSVFFLPPQQPEVCRWPELIFWHYNLKLRLTKERGLPSRSKAYVFVHYIER